MVVVIEALSLEEDEEEEEEEEGEEEEEEEEKAGDVVDGKGGNEVCLL